MQARGTHTYTNLSAKLQHMPHFRAAAPSPPQDVATNLLSEDDLNRLAMCATDEHEASLRFVQAKVIRRLQVRNGLDGDRLLYEDSLEPNTVVN